MLLTIMWDTIRSLCRVPVLTEFLYSRYIFMDVPHAEFHGIPCSWRSTDTCGRQKLAHTLHGYANTPKNCSTNMHQTADTAGRYSTHTAHIYYQHSTNILGFDVASGQPLTSGNNCSDPTCCLYGARRNSSSRAHIFFLKIYGRKSIYSMFKNTLHNCSLNQSE